MKVLYISGNTNDALVARGIGEKNSFYPQAFIQAQFGLNFFLHIDDIILKNQTQP